MQKVLFICQHNSARSQMAEALLRTRYGDYFEAYSAGMTPTGIHPLAVQVMKEIGIDISGYRSKHIDEFIDMDFDFVITVCDQSNGTCPFFPGAKRIIHRVFDEPSSAQGEEGARLKVFRRVRDEIASWIDVTFGGYKPSNIKEVNE